MFKIACEITNLLKDGKVTIAEATLSLDGKEVFRANGKSICNPKDEYDENSGVKIATARAKAKCYRKLQKNLENASANLLKCVDEVNLDIKKVTDRLAECADTIDTYANDDDDEDDTINTDSDEKDQ
jgi:hypothetical protein